MKKLLLVLCAALFIPAFVSAETEQKQINDQYVTVNADYLNFNAEVKDGKVALSRDADALQLGSDENWEYWKVLKSQKTDNPLYPDLGAIKYSPERGFGSHIDWDLLAGKTYYRVCATSYGTQRKRHCSNVVSVTAEESSKTYEKEEYKKEEYKKEVYQPKTVETKNVAPTKVAPTKVANTLLSEDFKNRIDTIFDAFVEKMNTQYNGDSSKMIARLEMITERLQQKQTSSVMLQGVLDHFSQRVEEQLALLYIGGILE